MILGVAFSLGGRAKCYHFLLVGDKKDCIALLHHLLKLFVMSLLSLILTAALLHCSLGSSCPASNPLSVYVEKLQNASKAIVSDMQSIVLQSSSAVLNLTNSQDGPPNVTTLYSALTANLNITQTENGLSNFTDAFDIITDAYFKACHGPADEKPNISNAQSILLGFLSLLENRSDITRMREMFGELSCLQNFSVVSSHVSKRALKVANLTACANAPNVNQLYQCLDSNNQLDCIFNLNNPKNCTTIKSNVFGISDSKRKKHCLAFVIDTTGSMSEEIRHARDVVQHFIQSEENLLTLCYILVPFNDYGYSNTAEFTKSNIP